MNEKINTLHFFSIMKQPLTLVQWYRMQQAKRIAMSTLRTYAEPLEQGLFTTNPKWIKRRIINDHMRHYAFKRVRMFMWFIRINPFVKAVAIANSCAFDSMSETSDVDLLVITTHNRTWLARLFLALPAKILRLRPGECIRAPICLSFFISQNNLNIKDLIIKDDIYFAYWLDSLIWIYDPDNMREELVNENTWTHETLQRKANIQYSPQSLDKPHNIIRMVLMLTNFDVCERFVQAIQTWKLPARITQARSDASSVVLNNHMIKTHLEDMRYEISQKYQKLTT